MLRESDTNSNGVRETELTLIVSASSENFKCIVSFIRCGMLSTNSMEFTTRCVDVVCSELQVFVLFPRKELSTPWPVTPRTELIEVSELAIFLKACNRVLQGRFEAEE